MASEVARGISVLVPDDPFGWIHWAYALHELKKTREAYDVAISAVAKFPEERTLTYNLAYYSFQLGNLKEAIQWLEKSVDVAGKKDIRQMALDDPDVEPLCNQISEV
jgi:predicted Zn-dependent protease